MEMKIIKAGENRIRKKNSSLVDEKHVIYK